MHLANSDNELIDASGNKMNIIGSIDINIELNGIHLVQNMKVLNSKTFRNIILGRDFLSHFETVEFDFPKNRIKLGHQWFNCVKIKGKEIVQLRDTTAIAGRTETVIQVKCNRSVSLITADFEPAAIEGKPGIYTTHCRVIPNMEQGRMQTSAHVARATVRFCHNYFYFGHPVVYVYFLFCFGYPVDSIPVPQIAKYIYFLVLLLRTTSSTGNFG